MTNFFSNSLRLFLGALFAIALIFVAMPSAKAADFSGEAGKFVEKISSEAVKILSNEKLSQDQRKTHFRKMLKRDFDIQKIGRFVLGRYWREASDKQKQQYLKLFEDFIVATYVDRFIENDIGQLIVKDSKQESEKYAVVYSTVTLAGDPTPVKLDWRLHKPKGKLQIVDLTIEGVSLSISQRSEFASIIESNGGDINALLDALRDKTAGNI